MLNNNAYTIAIIVLVGIGSFLLGWLAAHSFYNPTKESTQVVLKPLQKDITLHRRVYASSRGKRYYPWWCDAGNKITKENIVWYETPEKAKASGYTIAKACAGK